MLNSKLGKYTLEQELGAGGMGAVYRSFHPHLQRPVAIKVILNVANAPEEMKQRFFREAQVASRMSHPNIVRLYDVDVDETQGVPYLVMEYVEGKSLSDLMHEGPLSFDKILQIGSQLADALAYAHSQGVLHRDLKPGNVVLRPDGSVVLLDFGLARLLIESSQQLTNTNMMMGTPAYMAPEQVMTGQQPVDHRADLYALGVMLYQMLTGKLPFQGDTMQLLYAHVHTTPPRLEGQYAARYPQLVQLLDALLAKSPFLRPNSAAEVRAVLQSVERQAAGQPGPAVATMPIQYQPPPPTPQPQQQSWPPVQYQTPPSQHGQQSWPPVQYAQPQHGQQSWPPTQARTTSRGPMAFVAIAVVLLLLFGGAAAFFMLQDEGQTAEASTATPEGVIAASNPTRTPAREQEPTREVGKSNLDQPTADPREQEPTPEPDEPTPEPQFEPTAGPEGFTSETTLEGLPVQVVADAPFSVSGMTMRNIEDTYWIYGRLQNDGQEPREYMNLRLSFLDDSGNEIDYEERIIQPMFLDPGDHSGFEIILSRTLPQNLVSYRITIVSYEPGRIDPGYREMQIGEDVTLVPDFFPALKGTITNTGNQRVSSVILYATLYDAEQNVVGYAFGTPSQTIIRAGETVDFEITILVQGIEQRATSYEVKYEARAE